MSPFPRSALLGAVSAVLLSSLVSGIIVDPKTFSETEFDFIIAGGGTAGTALAARLSENPAWKIGVLEAGEYRPGDPRILIPFAYRTAPTWGNPNYDWGFPSLPQPNLGNRSVDLVRGKVLGGSSAVNLMGLVRAGAVEYDQIGQLGNEGWSWNEILPYFLRTEHIFGVSEELQNATHATFNQSWHGDNGPVHSTFSSWYSVAIPPFFSTLQALGLYAPYDGESGLDSSVFNPVLAIDKETQTRHYAAVAYYEPNAERKNFIVSTGSYVDKIEWSHGPNGILTATGVTYIDTANNQTYTAKVKREVILCGGSVMSPGMLERSGVGNKTILEKYGIETVIDRPTVGENYQDHLIASESFHVPNDIVTWDVVRDPELNASAYAEYVKSRTGVYTASINVIGFMQPSLFVDNATMAGWIEELDAQFEASNPTAGQRAMYAIQRPRLLPNSTQAIAELYATPSYYGNDYIDNTSYISLTVIPSHQFTRGHIHIVSSDPQTYPAIDLKAFDITIDKHIMTQGVKFLRDIVQTEPLASEIVSDTFPPANMTSDADWEEYAVNNANDPFHPCCTAAMLPEDLGGVVNNKLQVYGTTNVRVVDISILPLQLGTHLMATAYAIAERASDFIKEEYGYPTDPLPPIP